MRLARGEGGGSMSNRLLATLALVAALGLSAPLLMADHGDKGKNHQHGNKHRDDDDDQGWERRDGYEYRTYDERPPGWSRGKRPAGEIVDCLRAKPRSMVVRLTFIKTVPTTTTKMTRDGSSCAAQSLRFTAVWTFT